MNEETRQYIEEVVKTLETRLSRRGSKYNAIKLWEQRLLDRAKAVLKANPREHKQ